MPAAIIPVTSSNNQHLTVALNINGGTVQLQLRLRYNKMAGYWTMDIADPAGTPIVNCVPLLTGAWPAANILAPYQYMNIGSAFVINATGILSPDYPDNTNLGTDFLLLWDDNTNFVPGPPFGGILSGIPGPQGPPGPPGPGLGGFYYMGSSGGLVPVPGLSQFTQVAGASSGLPLLTGAATLNPPSPSVAGTLFLVLFQQPALGGCEITFDPYYLGVSTFEVDTTGNTQAAFLFQVLPGGASAILIQVAMNGAPIV